MMIITMLLLSWEGINMVISGFLTFLNICEAGRVDKTEYNSEWTIINWFKWLSNEILQEDGEYFM